MSEHHEPVMRVYLPRELLREVDQCCGDEPGARAEFISAAIRHELEVLREADRAQRAAQIRAVPGPKSA